MNNIKNSKGFTLIELLIAMAIFSMIIAGIVNSKIRQQGQSIGQQQAVEMQQTVRAVTYLMTRELRSAGYNPEFENHDTGITDATATSVTFNRVASDDGEDNDVDGDTDEAGELATITYAFAGTDLTVDFGGGGGPQLIAENIQNLGFTYFGRDGLGTADPDAVTSIQITIRATTPANQLARSTTNNTRTLTTRVYLRNLDF